MNTHFELLTNSISELKGVVFDCDGVMIDSRSANIGLYNKLLEHFNFPLMSSDQEEFVHMATFHQALHHILPEHLVDAAKNWVTEQAGALDYYSIINLHEGFQNVLDYLKKKNIFIGICTNRQGGLEHLFDRFNLHGYFSVIQTASNSQPKPSPDGLFKILDAWQVRKDQIVYVGDSKVDEMAANAANVPFWAFKNTDLSANVHLDSFSDMLDWIDTLLLNNNDEE